LELDCAAEACVVAPRIAEPELPCEPAIAVEVEEAAPTPAPIPRVAAEAAAGRAAATTAAIRNFFMVFSCCNGV
jgi:hypothetical protein